MVELTRASKGGGSSRSSRAKCGSGRASKRSSAAFDENEAEAEEAAGPKRARGGAKQVLAASSAEAGNTESPRGPSKLSKVKNLLLGKKKDGEAVVAAAAAEADFTDLASVPEAATFGPAEALAKLERQDAATKAAAKAARVGETPIAKRTRGGGRSFVEAQLPW